MTIKKCERCGDFIIKDYCNCKNFTITNFDGESFTIFALNEEDAALRFAKEMNEINDYYLIDNNETIEVNGKKFIISAEPDIYYRVTEIEGESHED